MGTSTMVVSPVFKLCCSRFTTFTTQTPRHKGYDRKFGDFVPWRKKSYQNILLYAKACVFVRSDEASKSIETLRISQGDIRGIFLSGYNSHNLRRITVIEPVIAVIARSGALQADGDAV